MLVDILSSHLLQGKDSLKRQCLLQQLVIAFAGTGDYSVTRCLDCGFIFGHLQHMKNYQTVHTICQIGF